MLSLWPLPLGTSLRAEVLRDPAQLEQARVLLLPHDAGPVADLQASPQRWAQLALLRRARAAGVPVLAWGSGAALLGRAAGGRVEHKAVSGALVWAATSLWPGLQHPTHLSGEVCITAPEWQVLASLRGVAAVWRLGQALAYAPAQPSDEQLQALMAHLPAPLRRPATLLEAVGGAGALRALLHDFYAQCRQDELLGPVFAAHVHDWQAHLSTVERFWCTMLGGPPAAHSGGPWQGNLNTIHAPLGITSQHLARWLALFEAACQRHLAPSAAALLSQRAQRMGARLGPRRP